MSSSGHPAWINAIRVRGLGYDALELEDADVQRFPVLRETLRRADDENLRVSTEYPEDAYDLIAKPSAVHTTSSEAEAIAEHLGSRSSSTGRHESKMVRFRGRFYRVSVVVKLCG